MTDGRIGAVRRTMIAMVALAAAGPALAQPPATSRAVPGTAPDFLPRAAATERATALHRMLDADGDGMVSRAEVDRWATSRGIPPAMVDGMFGDADTDRDGRITPAEQQGDALRSFDEADTDHDGRMTGPERDAAERRMMAAAERNETPPPLPKPQRR